MRTAFFTSFFVVLFALSCGTRENSSTKEPKVFDSRFSEYIKAYTSGTISHKDNIRVQFTENVTVPDNISADEVLDILPAVEGSLVKTGSHEITFSPTKKLKSGQNYVFSVKLGALMEMPKELEVFEINVKVIEQNFDVKLSPVDAPDPSQPDKLSLSGMMTLADFAEIENVEKMIPVPDGLTISWQHTSGTTHRFNVTALKRGERNETLNLAVSGSPIGIKKSENLSVIIPSIGVFAVLSTKLNSGDNTYVSIFFSDPLDTKQTLAGLIQIEGVKNPGMVIDGNELKVYVPKNLSGTRKLEISQGIKNTKNKTLEQNSVNYVAFEPEKPAVKLIGSGSILPSTDGLVLPFESVNLKAVRVEIVKIFEDNLPQFFQTNNYNGNDELIRVGQVVINKTISLKDQADDLSAWNRFTLELSSLFQAERGALYQIRIGFAPEDTNFPCEETFEAQEEYEQSEWSIYSGDGFYSYGNLWSYRYPNGYQWQERDNPCHVSYYHSGRFMTTSLLATDIGLIAKIGADNSMVVFSTNMTTAQPIQGNIKILDYQLQELGSSLADIDGMTKFNPARRPFLVVAEHQGQNSYLRLNDNEALSTSNFDVSGTRVKGNLKGFIYGERGVWRPGDDVYLSFMLEDPDNRIPGDHPIVMELRDPRGTVRDKQVLKNGVNGLYTFKTATSSDAPTGYWNANIAVGNNHFNKTVKIETIKPNRLKINLDLGEDPITYENRNLSGQMQVDWLTGITGSNLKVETELRLDEMNTTFDGYAQYEFDDNVKKFQKNPEVIFQGQVDEQGKAALNLQLPYKPNSPGAIKATFNTKAFEPGGGFSINSKSVTYYPYNAFVGLNLISAEGNRIKRDEQQTMKIVSLDAKGKPVNKSGLEFKIYKLNWSWWWNHSYDHSTNYLSSRYSTLVETKKVNTQGGEATVDFEIKSPNWGRYIAVIKDPASGHSASQVFYTRWYGGSDENSMGASLLEISTNKAEYAVGENIQVTMRGSLEGKALVSVENGSSVLESFWIKSEKEWTTFEIPASAKMAPNVYLNVTLLQPHGQTVNDLPIRMYGVAPIKVFDPNTKLQPVIKMADELRPGEPVEITITEQNAQPMSYTLAVVDEGLLDITNFKTPQPWDHFYSKEAIGVKTWDLYNDVIGAYGGRLERLISIGGGEGGLPDPDKMQENRFKPVVQFMGPFFLDAGGSKKHSFTMPQYIGSVKTMVVAGLNEAYGSAEKATPVVKPLMVLGTLPRVVGPGEKISLPVNVFRYKDHIKDATIEIETSGVLKLAGAKSQKIKLDNETGTLHFDLEVEEKIGLGKLIIKGTSGAETARHEINIASRSPNEEQTITRLVAIKAGEDTELPISLFGMDGTNRVSLELASIPPINLERRLQYLIRYPHGCVEQTVSSVFPQLYLDEVTELTNEERIKIESNIQTAIEKLSRFQSLSGGMTYWPGSTHTSSWGTSYAYHFLIEAQKKGFPVSTSLMNSLRKYQRNKATIWTKSLDHWDSDLIQSYRLFTLAIDGQAELGAMNRLRNTSDKSYQSVCKLAAAYAAIGQKDAAISLFRSVTKPLKEERYGYYYYNYGSYGRDLALKLEAYTYLEDYTEAFKILQELSERLANDSWMSTQTTAYSLLAIGKYVIANHSDEPMSADISYGSTSTTWTSDKAIYRSEINPKNGEKLKISNEGKSNLFATLTTTGTPKPGNEVAANSDMSISMRLVDEKGRSLNADSIKVGKSFDVLVKVKNNYAYGSVRDIALSHILPSGWEIQNDRLNDQQTTEYSAYNYQDIRDDRVYTYFHLQNAEAKTIKVSVTAAYPGKFYMPGVQSEAMYKATIHAKDKGKWVYVYE